MTNHSGRETMQSGFDIQRYTGDGHNLTIGTQKPSVFPEEQQVNTSHTLSELSTGTECSSTTVQSATSAADYQHFHQAMSIFAGAAIPAKSVYQQPKSITDLGHPRN